MKLASLDEITEAEFKLRESQNFSQKISETNPGLVTVYSLTDGQYLYVNQAITHILGYGREEFLSGGIEFAVSIVHKDDLPELMAKNQAALEKANLDPDYDDNTIEEFEYRMLHKQGHYIWVHTYGVVFSRGMDMLVDKLLNISVDITARKKSEEELKKTKEQLQQLNDELEQKVKERTEELEKEKQALKKETERNKLVDLATSDVVWDTNLLTNEINYNDNYSLLFGYEINKESKNSNSWIDRIHPEDRHRVISGIDRLMEQRIQQWSDEYRFVRHDGTSANILDRGCILYDENGTPYRMVGCMTDVTKLKEAEAKAKTSELKFRRIYESNIIGMNFANLNGVVIDANDAFLKMLGYNREDLANRIITSSRLTPEEYNDVTANALRELKAKGMSTPFEKEYFHKDGSRVAVLVGSAILSNEDAGTAVTYVIDITESKEANRVIRANQEKFRFLADAIPQKVWTATPDGTINYMNKVWLDFLENRLENLSDPLKITHPDDHENSERTWKDAIKTGESFELEHRFVDTKGNYRWHLSRGVSQRDESGNIVMWVGTNTDIHDQKTFAEALKISEDYFRELSDNVPFMIWKVDTNGAASYVNKSWIEFTGMSFEESLGTGWGTAVHPEDRAREFNEFTKAFAEKVSYNSKFRLKRVDGEYRYMLSQSTALFNPEFIGYIGSLTDITEQELAQQATELLMRQKDEFMSIASHELKTPITSMKAYLQIVARLSAKHEGLYQVHAFIEKANKQVNKLTALVEDLLDVTKIHAGKMLFSKSDFTIGEIIEECLDEIQNNIHTHTIEVNGNLDLVINADKHRIEQVLTNFLSNAIKYSPEADTININVEESDQQVKISVIDYGIGIPEDKIRYVFDRFFRVQESSQKFSGLGLGLYISSEIIARHGGEVSVESKDGQGSTFSFTIPKKR